MLIIKIISFIAPIGLIIAGLYLKLSNKDSNIKKIKKYWFFYVLAGILLLINRLYKLL